MARVCSEFKSACDLPDCECWSPEPCTDCGFPIEDHEEVTHDVDTCSDRVIVRLRPGQPVELRNEADEVVLVALPQSDGTMRVGVASEPYSDDTCDCDEVAAPDVQETCVDCGGPLACPHGVDPEDRCDECEDEIALHICIDCGGTLACSPIVATTCGCDETFCGTCDDDCPPVE